MVSDKLMVEENEDESIMFEIVEQKGVYRRILYDKYGNPYSENYYQCLGDNVSVDNAYDYKDHSSYGENLVKKSRSVARGTDVGSFGPEHQLYYVSGYEHGKNELKNRFELPLVRELGERSFVVLSVKDNIPGLRQCAKVTEFKMPLKVGKDKDFRILIVQPPLLDVNEETDGDVYDKLAPKADLKVARKMVNLIMSAFPKFGILLPFSWDVFKTKTSIVIKLDKCVNESQALMVAYIIRLLVWKLPDIMIKPDQYIAVHFGKIQKKKDDKDSKKESKKVPETEHDADATEVPESYLQDDDAGGFCLVGGDC